MTEYSQVNLKRHVDHLLALIAKEGIVSVCRSENLNESDVSLLKMISTFEDSFEGARDALKILNERHPTTRIHGNKIYTIQGMNPVDSHEVKRLTARSVQHKKRGQPKIKKKTKRHRK